MTERTVTVRLRALTSGLTGPLKQAGTQSAQFARTHERAMSTAGKAAMAFGAVGALGMKKAADAAIELNSQMANVATLIPGQTQRVYELRDGVQDLAVEVGKGTSDISEGLYQVVSAFGDTADTAQILEINAKAAKAGLAETTEAIDLTSAVTKGYGDTTAEAVQHASDLAFTTVRLGQTTFPELAASIGSVVPLAAALNVTQEELFGSMATFTGVTGNASKVATQLESALTALMNPSDELQGLMGELGFATGEAMISGLGFQGTIEAIADEAESSGVPIMKFLRRKEAVTLALAASGGQADVFTDKLGEMQDAAGSTEVALKEITDGVGAAGFNAEQASAAWQVATQRFGESVAPVWGDLAVRVHDVSQAFSELSPEAQEAVAKATMAASAVGLVGGAALLTVPKVIALNAALAGTGGILGSLGKTARFLTGPYGLAIMAGTKATLDLAAAFQEGRSSAREMADEIIATSDSAEEATRRIDAALSDHMGEVRSAEATWDRLKQGFSFDVVGDVVRDGARAWTLWRANADEATVSTEAGRNAIELLNSGVGGWVDRVRNASGVTDEMRAAAAEAGVDIDELTGEVAAAESAFDSLAPSIAAAFEALSKGFDPMSRYTDNLAAMNAANRKAAEEAATATESSKDSWEDYFTETEASFAAYMSGLDQTLTDQRDWYANLNKIRDIAGDDYADMLAAQGPEFASLHAEIANAEHDEIRKAAETAQTIRDEATQEAVDRLIASTPEWVDAAGQVSGETVAEIADKLNTTEDVVRDAIANSIPALEAQFRAMTSSAGSGAAATVAAMAHELGKGTAEAAKIVNAWANVTGECLSPLIMRPYTKDPS